MKTNKMKKKEIESTLDSFWKKHGINKQFNIFDLGSIPTKAQNILQTTGDIAQAENAYIESIEKYRVK